jgi:hypothetical protein
LKEYTFQYRYGGKDVPYTVWATAQDHKLPPIILYLGTVQIDKLVQWTAEACPPNTLVVQGAPHWYAKADGSDIPEYMLGFIQQSFQKLKDVFAITSATVIAESQAVPGTIHMASLLKDPSFLKQLILLQPLGLNPNAYGHSDEDRIRSLKKRGYRNLRRQLISLITDSRLRQNYKTLRGHADLTDAVSRAHYASGLTYDSADTLSGLSRKQLKITIISGEKDELFPVYEIQQTLQKNNINIDVTIIPRIPHSPLHTHLGQELLRRALVLVDEANVK